MNEQMKNIWRKKKERRKKRKKERRNERKKKEKESKRGKQNKNDVLNLKDTEQRIIQKFWPQSCSVCLVVVIVAYYSWVPGCDTAAALLQITEWLLWIKKYSINTKGQIRRRNYCTLCSSLIDMKGVLFFSVFRF